MKKHKVLKIKVTKAHIAKGEPSSGEYCPIALALMQQGLDSVTVEGDLVTFLDPATDNEITLDAPKCINNFVRRFDDGLPVKPFGFKIELPISIPGRIRC